MPDLIEATCPPLSSWGLTVPPAGTGLGYWLPLTLTMEIDMALILAANVRQKIFIGDDITIKILVGSNNYVRLSIDAPPHMEINGGRRLNAKKRETKTG